MAADADNADQLSMPDVLVNICTSTSTDYEDCFTTYLKHPVYNALSGPSGIEHLVHVTVNCAAMNLMVSRESIDIVLGISSACILEVLGIV